MATARWFRTLATACYFGLLACNDIPAAPTDPEATLAVDEEWSGVALIHSAIFQDPELVDQIIAESRAVNAAGDSVPCIWWRRVRPDDDGANCTWRSVEVFTGDRKLDTYLADSGTVAAILPDSAGDYPITLYVGQYRSDLGTARNYGFTGARDGPAITQLVLDYPGNGAGRILARTGEDENYGILRYLDLRTGDYRDFDLGSLFGRPMVPGLTWDPQVVLLTTYQPVAQYWRLTSGGPPVPVDSLSITEHWGWGSAVAVSPTERVVSSKHSTAFVTDSSYRSVILEEPTRVKYSLISRRWVPYRQNRVWDFAGNEAFSLPTYTRFSAIAFSPTGDTLFVAGHPNSHPPSSDTTYLRSIQVVDAHSGRVHATMALDTEGSEGDIDDMVADPSSRWLYIMRGCKEPRLEIVDRFTLERVRRIDLDHEAGAFSCLGGSLIFSRLWENALYFIMSDGGLEYSRERSRIYRFEIPPPM